MPPMVSVLVLNYKQPMYVPRCIDALMHQTYPRIEIFFIDNASGDGSVEYVKSYYPSVRVIENTANLYFSKAHNAAIRESVGDYVLPLNADIVLTETYVEHMVSGMGLDPQVGMISGKLLLMDKHMQPLDPPVIDSTGLWFTPELRHFDRGSLEMDRGQYNQTEYVFGASGAAPLYRRDMLEDVAFLGEYFDEDFVFYREDADLAWRAQLLGWKGLYIPTATGFHVRAVRPTDDRKKIPPVINMHSVKNRFLLRIKNQTWSSALRFLLPTLWRDMLVVGAVVLVEHTSLPAFGAIIKMLPRMLEKRRWIMNKRRVSDDYITRWFSYKPVSFVYQGNSS